MNRFFVFAICYLCFHMQILSAQESSLTSCQRSEEMSCKFYIQPSQIFFLEQKIFVEIENNLIEVESLMTDSEGIHCAVKVKGYPKSWICPICSEYNDDRNYCEACGYWPAGPKLLSGLN